MERERKSLEMKQNSVVERRTEHNLQHHVIESKRKTRRGTTQIVNTIDGSHQDVNHFVALEKLEQTLTKREQTKTARGHKYRTNKWLFCEWSKSAFL